MACKVITHKKSRYLVTALALTEGNVSKAAVLLNMNQNALFRLIKKYGLKS